MTRPIRGPDPRPSSKAFEATVRVTVNGEAVEELVDARTTLLDFLREHLRLTGAKQGCDHGQCGSCTVLVDGRRINSCLQLVAGVDGCQVVTVEGLGTEGGLDRIQEAFLEYDAYQCGYCTPGQVCSAVGMLAEFAQGWPSAVTDGDDPEFSDAEVRERMSGNLCRCGAYANLVPAILEAGR